MKTFKTTCLTTILLSALTFVTSALAQDATVSLQRLDQVLAQIIKNEHEMAQLMQRYSPSHPKVLELKSQHDLLHAELAALNPHGALEHPDPSLQLRQTMQRFADTMDQLSKQLEAIEKLGNQIGAEKSESRKAFFESSEKMFLAAKIHFAGLEKLLGDKSQELVTRDREDLEMTLLLQARQIADAHKSQAQAMERTVAELIAREWAHHLPESQARIDQLDERLSRIERLLEKLLKSDGGPDTSESDR